MKANEAPEKIYIHVKANKELGTTWHGKKITNSDIEYVRTDAFIEKAVKWIEGNAINYWGTDAVDNGKMMLDFKIAMRL